MSDAPRSGLPPSAAGTVRAGTAEGRWIIAATVLGSGIAFLDSTVVNVALPTIGRDLDTDLAGLQWVLDSYLVTLTGLLLLGGSLGDRYGRRRIFVAGLVAFTAASLLCSVAPGIGALVAARALQGAGAALLVPGSLAIISASFHPDDRGRAVGSWSALAGVASAVGPFVGGWLVQTWSWRLIFLINLPLAAVAVWITLRKVPESRDVRPHGAIDVAGAVLISVSLAALAFAAIEGPSSGRTTAIVFGGVGLAALGGFVAVEARRDDPMLPLGLFRSRQFVGANLTTLAVYAGLGAATFLVILQLQLVVGWSPVAAGASLLPVTIAMLLLSSRAGVLAQRIGPRLPMTVGPLVAGVGLLLYRRVGPEATFLADVLPAAAVLGLGLALTVAPLTATVLGSVEEGDLGVASGVNNAVARLAGLLSIAVLPGVVGLDTTSTAASFDAGFDRAVVVAAVLCFVGGLVAWATVRTARVAEPTPAPLEHPCADPCRLEPSARA